MKIALLALSAIALGSAGSAQTTSTTNSTGVERDARGIPVMSDPAMTPSGANVAVTIQPGATVVPAPNQSAVFTTQASTKTYPACTREITDGCVQAYERGRRPAN